MTIKCLDGKILNYVNNHFLNLIYIKSAGDREIEIVLLNQAGKIWFFFLQVRLQSFLEILQSKIMILGVDFSGRDGLDI